MAAIAVSADDERRIVQLGKRLGARSKSGLCVAQSKSSNVSR